MRAGAVIFHENFEFHDGEHADKLLIVLNDGIDKPLLLLKTTSQQKGYRLNEPGCHPEKSYFFLPVSWDSFSKDTWVLLYEQYPIPEENLNGRIRVLFHLQDQNLRAIINCLRRTEDVSAENLSLL